MIAKVAKMSKPKTLDIVVCPGAGVHRALTQLYLIQNEIANKRTMYAKIRINSNSGATFEQILHIQSAHCTSTHDPKHLIKHIRFFFFGFFSSFFFLLQ